MKAMLHAELTEGDHIMPSTQKVGKIPGKEGEEANLGKLAQ